MNGTGFWDRAYRDNAPALLGVLRRYVKDVTVAQDLLHEVFITAITKYESYTGKGCFEGWLHRIAVNVALMYLRNEKNKQVPAEAVLAVANGNDADDNPDGDARTAIEAADFSGEELLTAIDRLPEHHKLVFNMYVMDRFSHKQISIELNISPGTSKSHLARARKKIQQFLYEEALKKKLKDRRRASALMLLFPAKLHFIDKLYRDRLSDFSLPPTGGTELLPAALEQHAASASAQSAVSMASTASQTVTVQSSASAVTQTVTTAAFWGSKRSYLFLCCGTAVVTASLCWVSMSKNSPLNRPEDTEMPVADIQMHASEPAVDSAVYDAAGSLSPDPSPKRADALPTESANPPRIDNMLSTGNMNIQQEDIVLTSGKAGSIPTGADGTSKNEEAVTSRGMTSSPAKRTKYPKTISNNRTGTSKAVRTLEEKEPVVVRKQIIQHQTVIVRDTILITE